MWPPAPNTSGATPHPLLHWKGGVLRVDGRRRARAGLMVYDLPAGIFTHEHVGSREHSLLDVLVAQHVGDIPEYKR